MAREKDNPRLKKAQERVKWQYITHAGKWLDADAVSKYQKEAEQFPAELGDVGGRRELRIKLQEEYGVTEIEAVNILNGYNVQDYLAKYERIRNKIPTFYSAIKEESEEDDYSH